MSNPMVKKEFFGFYILPALKSRALNSAQAKPESSILMHRRVCSGTRIPKTPYPACDEETAS
jgi:hypothetical protein